MKRMTIWSLIGLVTLFSIGFVYKYFDQAIPLIHLHITMDKNQACSRAKHIAKEKNWSLDGYDSAMMFESNFQLQSFAELEGGGKEAFVNMMKEGYHHPYAWRVRFFKEKEITEYLVKFTPDGAPYGFERKVPEDESGTNLSKEKAQEKAEEEIGNWNNDLSLYTLVEYEKQEKPSKRLDHTFVYERTDVTLKKGLYRLHVQVSGDQVTSLQHKVKIPDEFIRRYAEMYSSNTLIATIATVLSALLYLFLIGLAVFWFLFRKKYFIIQPIMKLVGFLIVLITFSNMNNWALYWNSYQTVLSKFQFGFQLFAITLLQTIFFSFFVGAILMLSESAGRYVFGKHIQFFSILSLSSASSWTVVEQVLLGYCAAAMMLAYAVGFMMIASQWNWWIPFDSLIDPNILSSYMPALSPFVNAFRAGFWEEIGFRALPIAGTLLITRKSKRPWIWLGMIVVVQALLFGAAHANYMFQPSYARIIELFVPSVIFALLYYVFGLLPGIVMHFMYDAVLMLLPVFASDLLLQKILAIVFMAIPLIVLFIQVIRAKGLHKLPSSAQNDAWHPVEDEEVVQSFTRSTGETLADRYKWYALVGGMCGLFLFLFSSQFQFDTPKVMISKEQAIDIGKNVVQRQFGKDVSGWTALHQFRDLTKTIEHGFIWQRFGKKVYKDMLQSYLKKPHYMVRFVQFDGSVEQRAEEFQVWIGADGTTEYMSHKLPEAQKGADVSEEKAQKITYDFIKKEYGLVKDDVSVISIDSKKHENRRDWELIFKDVKHYTLSEGQGRISVTIGGDKITNAHRYVYVPEEWSRKETGRLVQNQLIKSGCWSLFMFLIMISGLFGVRRIGLFSIPFSKVGALFFVLIIVTIASLISSWSFFISGFSTMMPFMNQLISFVSLVAMSRIFLSFVQAFLLVVGVLLAKRGQNKHMFDLVSIGFLLACFVQGVVGVLNYVDPALYPKAPLYSLLSFDYLPAGIFLQILCGEMSKILLSISMVYIFMSWYRTKETVLWKEIFFTVALALIVVGSYGIESIPSWLIMSVVWAAVWYFLSRYFYKENIELCMVSIAAVVSFQLVPSIWYQICPSILFSATIAISLFCTIIILLARRLQAMG